MRIGLWNIDHAELHDSGTRLAEKYHDVFRHLDQQRCDVYVVTEANAAMQLTGCQSQFSEESPFQKKGRCYKSPNRYHQVAIYSRLPISKVAVTEPVNGLLCKIAWQGEPLFVYGNVITIKDQWKPDSKKGYSHRLDEQLEMFRRLATKRFIVCGDFNLRLGWAQRKNAFQRVEQVVLEHGWFWPTKMQTDTVQHVIHSLQLNISVTIDSSVKDERLSDHPFVLIDVAADSPPPGRQI